METTIRDLQNRFDQAELEADKATLRELIVDDFLYIAKYTAKLRYMQ